ncbi:MAG: GGDEF domain-containing protein [Acutalibacteraceae bacterium]
MLFKKGNTESWYDLAFKDNLTGLLNRNAYNQKIKELEKHKQKNTWIMLFDIDDFKKINDTKGHLFGDEVLIRASNRLRGIFCARNHNIYRIGGDEFLVISENIGEEEIINLLLQLKDKEIKDNEYRFSKGYSKVESCTTDALRDAFVNADDMLYADKNSKKTGC